MISLEIVPFGLAFVKEEMCVSWRKCLRLGEWQSWNAELELAEWSKMGTCARKSDRVSRCLREFFNKAHYWRRFPQICTAQEIDGIKDFPIMSYQLSKKFLSLLSRWSLALKLTRKRFFFVSWAIHCENPIWNIQIFALNLHELKYLRRLF